MELRTVSNSGAKSGIQKWSWPPSLQLFSLGWCGPSMSGLEVRQLEAGQSDVPRPRELALDSYYPAHTKGHGVFPRSPGKAKFSLS